MREGRETAIPDECSHRTNADQTATNRFINFDDRVETEQSSTPLAQGSTDSRSGLQVVVVVVIVVIVSPLPLREPVQH